MKKTIAVIEGDDAAPEAMRPTVALLESLDLGLEFVRPLVGEAAVEAAGSPFPDTAKAIIDGADATLFGSTSGQSGAALMYLRWGKGDLRERAPLPASAGLRQPAGAT